MTHTIEETIDRQPLIDVINGAASEHAVIVLVVEEGSVRRMAVNYSHKDLVHAATGLVVLAAQELTPSQRTALVAQIALAVAMEDE